MYSCWAELFEIELIVNIKVDLTLNNQQRLICHLAQQFNSHKRACAHAHARHVITDLLDCGLGVSDFELQSNYYVQFHYSLERHEPSHPLVMD